MRTVTLILLLASCCTAQDATIAQLELLLPAIGAKEFEARQQAQEKWERIVYPLGSPGNAERKAVASAMAEWLEQPGVRVPAKVFMLRQLERIGGTEVVATLANLLADRKKSGIRESARRALAANPSTRAGAALREQYAKAESTAEKRALLNAIGYRAEDASAEFLTRIARTEKGPTLVAANAALSKLEFGNGTGGALRRGTDKDAILRRADRLVAEGKPKQALALYRSLAKNQVGKPAGAAAYRGLLETAPEAEVVDLIRDAFVGEDIHRRQVAMSRIRTLSTEAAKQLAKRRR